ncbi:hypothetical protein [Sedimentibacter sp.]|uniref:hypothetical protein n=1 Tax=Sedimentibacter sp. TaxID=1960295 RepID=UPI0028A74ACD|nr:hypothetical protein [Sedimentibacter sp.]
MRGYKKPTFWLMAVLVILLIVVAVSAGTNPRRNYEFSGTTWVQEGRKYFYAEDTPESKQEELVYLYFLYGVEGDYEKKYDLISERNKIGLDIERNAGKDIYSSYVLHSITTVDNDSDSYKYFKEKNNLTEIEVINVVYTKKDSLNLTAMGPQWGNGTYTSGYIVGKTAEDQDYKIQDFMMPLRPDGSEMNSKILSSSVNLYIYEDNEAVSERVITDSVSKTNINMLLRNVDESGIISNGNAPPETGSYVKAVINDKVYYVYEINSRYYIKKSNKDIGNMMFDEYRDIKNYSRYGTIPEPIYISAIVSGITYDEYKKTGGESPDAPDLSDYRKIKFELYVEFPDNIKNRKIETSGLAMIKKGNEENRLRGGGTFERDNEAENFAIYEEEIVFDARGLTDDDIINIFKTREASVSWTDSDNNYIKYEYDIGEIIEIKDK